MYILIIKINFKHIKILLKIFLFNFYNFVFVPFISWFPLPSPPPPTSLPQFLLKFIASFIYYCYINMNKMEI